MYIGICSFIQYLVYVQNIEVLKSDFCLINIFWLKSVLCITIVSRYTLHICVLTSCRGGASVVVLLLFVLDEILSFVVAFCVRKNMYLSHLVFVRAFRDLYSAPISFLRYLHFCFGIYRFEGKEARQQRNCQNNINISKCYHTYPDRSLL